MSIHKYTKSSGEICYRIMFRVNGKLQQRRGFKTKSEAKSAEREILTKIAGGYNITSPNLTVGDYLDSWYSTVREHRKYGDSQHKRYGQHIESLRPYLGHFRLVDLSFTSPKIVWSELRKEWRKRWSVRSIAMMEGLLKAAFQDGVKHDVLTKNPLDWLEVMKPEDNELKPKPKFFTISEQKKLMDVARDYAKETDPRWFMRPYIGLHTGMRSGEIHGLQWKHIDLENKVINVEQTIQYSAGDNNGAIKKPKSNAGERLIFITDEIVAEIKAYKIWLAQYFFMFGKKIQPDSFFLPNADLACMPAGLPRSRWDWMLKQAGIKHRGFHALRHTHASNLIMQKVNPKIIQDRLGHSTFRLTMDTYGHLMPEESEVEQQKAMLAIEAKLHA